MPVCQPESLERWHILPGTAIPTCKRCKVQGWRPCATGWVRADGTWRVRGPLMGQPMFWLYRVGVGRYTPTGRYEDCVHFTTADEARRYADALPPTPPRRTL